VASTVAAVLVTRFTWPLFAAAPFAPIFGAVALTSQWGSERAGLLTVVLGAIGAPIALGSNSLRWDPRLIVFVAVGVYGAHVIASRKRSMVALRARENVLRATVAAERQAQIDLRSSEQKLRQAQKMEAVGQLVAGVAHNFNNLLTVTMGYTDLLIDRHPRGDTDYDNLEEIRKATERGAALTRQLLAFGHKHEVALARVDLNHTVSELREMLKRVMREDIGLTIDTPGTPVFVRIDPHDVEQVVLNLVLNSRDALPEGGTIQISVALERVDATNTPRDIAVPAGDYARLRIRDNGVGMTPEVQAHLFEPFFTTKDVGQGTGLGLAFVHGIARHGGGFVAIETAPSQGTTVSVYLPQAPASVRDVVSGIPQSAGNGRSAAGATILLVEDEGAVRSMTAKALKRAGYNVLAAPSPTEAFQLFDLHETDIDLLLTDVVMPDMHGPALAQRLIARRPDLPVLFVSGYSDAIPAASQTERVAFLAKPFAPSRLVSTVAELLTPRTT
jgi:two-component system cell cycle sensor histidine kinase/response regulator CckA